MNSINHSLSHSLTHSQSLFDAPGIEAFTSEYILHSLKISSLHKYHGNHNYSIYSVFTYMKLSVSHAIMHLQPETLTNNGKETLNDIMYATYHQNGHQRATHLPFAWPSNNYTHNNKTLTTKGDN